MKELVACLPRLKIISPVLLNIFCYKNLLIHPQVSLFNELRIFYLSHTAAFIKIIKTQVVGK